MEKAISTALFVIASVAASLALINAVLPATGKSTGALLDANATTSDRIRTDLEIVLAVGSTSTDQVIFWAKNVGPKTIDSISAADVFLTFAGSSKRVDWASTIDCPTLISGGTECWEHVIEGGASDWPQSGTVKVTLRLLSVSTGVHRVRMTLPNGVSADKEFSV